MFTHSDALAPLRIATTYRAELKITDDQAAAIGEPDSPPSSRHLNDISAAEALKGAKEADAKSAEALSKGLTPEQMTRL